VGLYLCSSYVLLMRCLMHLKEIFVSSQYFVRIRGKGNFSRKTLGTKNWMGVDLKKIWYEDVNWVHLTRDRIQRQDVVNATLDLRGFIKCGEFSD
jgi:hypothetical protein